MSVHFHPLPIKRIVKETPDCVSVSFDVPEGLQKEFLYREGQNITIKATINGCEVRRSYSICTAPHEEELKIAIKSVEGGLFSPFANNKLKAGDILEVLPPTGKFNLNYDLARGGNFLAFAAGSGITPVISIVKHALKASDNTRFTLVYGNRSRSSIIFFDELEALKNKYMQRFNLVNILSRERTDADINFGRIDVTKLRSLEPIIDYKSYDSIFICGPAPLIFASAEFLEQMGIEKRKIHFELFSTPGQETASTAVTKAATKTDTGPAALVTIKLDGRSFDFPLAYGGQSILDAALQQGADLPYACKGGVCCTCRARLLEGKVTMDVNYALEEEELEAGFILTCQSHPRTEKIIVDFDVK